MTNHWNSWALSWRRSTVGSVCTALLLLSAVELVDAQERPLPTQNALAGSRVFGAEGCGRCHAINGLGGTEAPDLARFPRPRTFFDLAAAMWNHLPRMVERMEELGIERPRLSQRETGDLIAFLYTLDYFDAAGDVEQGRELFRSKKCVACHQVGGDGGVVGPNLSTPGKLVAPIEIATAMWNHGSAMSEVMRNRGIDRPRFTATELRDLIAFLEFQNPEVPEGQLYVLPGLAGDGRRLFSEKGCVQCHAVVGAGGVVGPDLAERGAYRSLLAFAAAMWNKVPAMTRAMRARGLSVPQLTASEMGDLVGYLYSVKFFAQSGDPQRGRRQLRNKGCLECHALGGRGGQGASDLAAANLRTPAEVIAALWNHALVDEKEAGLASWPVLEPNEMADIAGFLQATAPPR